MVLKFPQNTKMKSSMLSIICVSVVLDTILSFPQNNSNCNASPGVNDDFVYPSGIGGRVNNSTNKKMHSQLTFLYEYQ